MHREAGCPLAVGGIEFGPERVKALRFALFSHDGGRRRSHPVRCGCARRSDSERTAVPPRLIPGSGSVHELRLALSRLATSGPGFGRGVARLPCHPVYCLVDYFSSGTLACGAPPSTAPISLNHVSVSCQRRCVSPITASWARACGSRLHRVRWDRAWIITPCVSMLPCFAAGSSMSSGCSIARGGLS